MKIWKWILSKARSGLQVFFIISVLVAFLLPNHYYPWASFYLEYSAFFALFIAFLWLLNKRDAVRVPRILLIFFTFSAIPIVQMQFGLSLFYGDAILAFFYIGAFALSLVVSSSIATADIELMVTDYIAFTLVFVGIVSVWLAMIQWLQLWSSPWIHNLPAGARPYANLGQANNYSSLIWIALYSLYYLFERKRVGLTGLLVAGVFLVTGAALAQSRTSWVVFGVILTVLLIQRSLFVSWKWQRLVFLLMIAGAFFILSFASIELTSFLFGSEPKKLRADFTDIRLDMWASLAHAIMEKPWFGFGWGQVSVAQLEVAEMYPAVGLTQYSHNLFLDLMLWNGIPIGLLIFALISFLWLRVFFYAYTEKGFYSLCCFSVLLVHSLLEYPHAYSYFLLLAGFFIGISAGEPINSSQFRVSWGLRSSALTSVNRLLTQRFTLPKYVLTLCVLIFAVSLVIAWRDYRVLEEDHRLLRFEAASIGTLKAEKKAPDVLFFDQLQAFTWVARTHSFNDLTDDEVSIVERVAKRYPLPMPLLKLAKLRMVQNKPDEAVAALKTIEHLYGESTYESAQKELEQFQDQTQGYEY